MSYQVLARKWRPHDFDGVVGQEHVVKALRHALREKRIHHAYLFTGTRGVGKTTLSRILAKCLNCTGPDGKGGITDKPCGVCEACRSIDEGNFVDYIEMDAASNRGVDEMTALLEQAMYPPTNARFKVYMIDEVHQLSNTAFNAMLKTLEEPPEYVKFILATTDPQKVPVTVLSRCLQFNLRNMTPQEVAGHMARILKAEKITAEPAALKLLAAGARGSMRDGLSLLDQAIAFSDGAVTLESVREMLGVVDSSVLIRLLGCLRTGDAEEMLRIADEMGMRSYSSSQALRDIAGILHRTAIAQRVPKSLEGDPDSDGIRELARDFSPDEVQLYYQIAINGRNDLHLAPDEYAGFTMTLLRMIAFRPSESRSTVPRRIPPAKPAAEPKPAPAPAAPAPAPTEPGPAAQKGTDPDPGLPPPPAIEDVPPWVQTEPAEEMIPSDDAPAAPEDLGWQGLLARAGLQGLEWQVAARSECVRITGESVVLRNDMGKSLASGRVKKTLEEALSRAAGRPLTVVFEEGAVTGNTVWKQERKEQAEARARMISGFKANPLVRSVAEKFSGLVLEDSVTGPENSSEKEKGK